MLCIKLDANDSYVAVVATTSEDDPRLPDQKESDKINLSATDIEAFCQANFGQRNRTQNNSHEATFDVVASGSGQKLFDLLFPVGTKTRQLISNWVASRRNFQFSRWTIIPPVARQNPGNHNVIWIDASGSILRAPLSLLSLSVQGDDTRPGVAICLGKCFPIFRTLSGRGNVEPEDSEARYRINAVAHHPPKMRLRGGSQSQERDVFHEETFWPQPATPILRQALNHSLVSSHDKTKRRKLDFYWAPPTEFLEKELDNLLFIGRCLPPVDGMDAGERFLHVKKPTGRARYGNGLVAFFAADLSARFRTGRPGEINSSPIAEALDSYPFVIGLQHKMPPGALAEFVSAFYTELAEIGDVMWAFYAARRFIMSYSPTVSGGSTLGNTACGNQAKLSWHVPVLYTSHQHASNLFNAN